MRKFDDRYKAVALKYIRNAKYCMQNMGLVMSFPEQMAKKIKELREKSKRIMQDSRIGDKEKQEIVAKCDEKIKEIQQSIARFHSQHSIQK